MKKIDISEVTPFDQLYITISSKVEGQEEVNVPKYVNESEMISHRDEGVDLDESYYSDGNSFIDVESKFNYSERK